MTIESLQNEIRIQHDRYKAHLNRGSTVLRDGSQQEIGSGIADYFKLDKQKNERQTNGYVVAPGGLGKTVIAGDYIVGINTLPGGRFVLGDKTFGKRTLISVPSNQLVDQWEEELLGKLKEDGTREDGVFKGKILPENVGVYHATDSEAKRLAALAKPIVIITHDSARALSEHMEEGKPAPRLKAGDFNTVLIDEVDEKPRGDVTSRFIKNVLFEGSVGIGLTATHIYRNDKTIGDYLFEGKKPICEITHEEAVNRGDIAPHINIVFKPTIKDGSKLEVTSNRWDDYTEAQKLAFIKQTGSDKAIVDIIEKGTHPETGKPLRELSQLHEGITVAHSREIADMLNDRFGTWDEAQQKKTGYAEVVWGEMDKDEHKKIMQRFKAGEIKAVVQCKYWGRGTNIPGLEMTIQHAPGCSPNKITQFHTRASRRHDGKKIPIYLSPYIQGIDQLVIGELLDGMYMVPDHLKKWKFPPTEGQKGTPAEPQPWPHIDGVEVVYTQEQRRLFAQQRDEDLYAKDLRGKPAAMLNVEEMAHKLNITPEILEARVYAPLQKAFHARAVRDKFIKPEDRTTEDGFYVNGHRFPVSYLGEYKEKGKKIFCIDQSRDRLAEFALYGSLNPVPPEMLSMDQTAQRTGAPAGATEELWEKLQQAFFERKPYQRSVEIDGIPFNYEDFGFHSNRAGAPEFFIAPDALQAAYCHSKGYSDITRGDDWAKRPAVTMLKNSDWYTLGGAIEALELNPYGDKADTVRKRFTELEAKAKGLRPGDERTVSVGNRTNAHDTTVAQKYLPQGEPSEQLCVSKEYLERLKSDVQLESAYDPAVGASRKRA